jgi:hypothetical protein
VLASSKARYAAVTARYIRVITIWLVWFDSRSSILTLTCEINLEYSCHFIMYRRDETAHSIDA